MIPLFVENGAAYVWNAKDWETLRKEYRICGSLIGALPSHPRQNEFNGLPLALASVEAALLVENGICELLHKPSLQTKPTNEDKEQHNLDNQRLYEEQKEALKKRRIQQFSEKIDVILAGKRKKLLEKGCPEKVLDKETLLQEEINKIPPLNPAHVLIHLPIEDTQHREGQQLKLNDLKPSVLEGKGAIQYAIFKDLWERRLYVTDGLKFGVDFLVYPGDPMKFHAMYMVLCAPSPNSEFPPSRLVALGRLSVSVNKLAVIASINKSNEASYQTLQWHECLNG